MKRNQAVGIAALAALVLLGGAAICRAEGDLYTKYNIHVQMEVSRKGERSYQASYSGWIAPGQGHDIIPPNTKVIYERGGGKPWEKGFTLLVPDAAGKGLAADKIFFEYNAKNMAMTADEYVALITSPTPVSLDGLSRKDAEGVKAGTVSPGMSRRGVMTALGYPAAHKTPNPEKDMVWTYWRNRFNQIEVYFDADGSVRHVRN